MATFLFFHLTNFHLSWIKSFEWIDDNNIFLHGPRRAGGSTPHLSDRSYQGSRCGKGSGKGSGKGGGKSWKSSKSENVPCDTPTVVNPSPQSFVSAAPTFNVERICSDHLSYTFLRDNGRTGTCAWIQVTQRRKNAYCDKGHVKGACRKACNNCSCSDNKSFSFLTNQGRNKKCEWINARNMLQRRRKYCYSNDGTSASKVGDECPNSCGFCLLEQKPSPAPINNAPPRPSPDSCSDVEDFSFRAKNGRKRKCVWISKRKVRRNRYCYDDDGISTSRIGIACMESCGFCLYQDEPKPSTTSPTSFPTSTVSFFTYSFSCEKFPFFQSSCLLLY